MNRRMLLKFAFSMFPIYGTAKIQGSSLFEGRNERNPVLKIPSGLKEEVWEICKNPDLLRKIWPNEADDCEGATHAYALYLDNNTHLLPLTCIQSTGEMVMPRITFATLIERLAPHTWEKLVFSCAMHDLCIMDWIAPASVGQIPICENPIDNWLVFKTNLIADEMLKDSRGAIIWAHQIHALYGLFDPRIDKMLEFRKILNANNIDRLREYEGKYFISGCDLLEIIKERMIFGYTNYLNLRKATMLGVH
jgi:hypothetical protein